MDTVVMIICLNDSAYHLSITAVVVGTRSDVDVVHIVVVGLYELVVFHLGRQLVIVSMFRLLLINISSGRFA
jgi:hypothetical protein